MRIPKFKERRKSQYKLPVIYKVYQFIDKKMRKVAVYRTERGLEKKLGLYAQAMPEAKVYVTHLGSWFRVEFSQTVSSDGEPAGWEWKMVESQGMKRAS